MKRFFALAGLALALADFVSAAQTYRGFTIDDSAVRKAPNLEALLGATKEQIDLVHAVGLPADVLAFVQEVKFELVPAGTFKRPTPGRYTGRGAQSVQVSAAIVSASHKPVLLHELMHAYHDQRVPQGFRNRVILGFYQQAKGLSAYATRSHMMQNDREFFACAATTYLFGVTAQEPFERSKVRNAQPAFHDYLKQLFGPGAGGHVGSLKR